MNLPPHANSAVDGYAFTHADLAPGWETVLPVSRPGGGRSPARPYRRARHGDPDFYRRSDAGKAPTPS